MITVRKSDERGRSDFGWLDSRHTFSFGEYLDREHMGFRSLRVINDDRITPGAGFPSHGHRNMEIISYVVDGALEHKDSMGNGSVIRPGDVQRMTAGTGVMHSEFNPSEDDGARFLQIWIIPEQQGLAPGYDQQQFSVEERKNTLKLVASSNTESGAVKVHQDADIYAAVLEAGASVSHEPSSGRHVWVQVVKGGVTVNGEVLGEGDGAAIKGEPEITVASDDGAEVLVFDLA